MRGHIHKRTHTTKNGKTTVNWYVVIDSGRDEHGRRRQKWHGSYRTRKDAEVAKAKLVADMHGGTYVAPTTRTLAEWVRDSWLPTMRTQIKPTTWDSYRRTMDLHVLSRIGHLPLGHVTVTVLNTLYAELAESGRRIRVGGLAPKTIRSIHTMVHKALADAVDLQLLGSNPADRAKPPRMNATRGPEMQAWSVDELRAFLTFVADHRLRVAFHLAAMTGMRRGEILGLRWHDIDIDAQRLSIRHTLVAVAYEVRSSTPKNHQARVVDLDARTVDLLRKQRSAQAVDRAEWGKDYEDQDLVFAKENGEPIHPHSFSQFFERLVINSGLPRIRLHDLRHTHATIALKAGVPVKVVSERLGHEDPAFTLRQYAHVIPGMQRDAAAQIAALLEDPAT